MKNRYHLSILIYGVGLWIGLPILIGAGSLLLRSHISTQLQERKSFRLVIENNRKEEASINEQTKALAPYSKVAPLLQPAKLKGALSEFFDAYNAAGFASDSFDRAISFSEGDPGLFGGISGKTAQRATIDLTARMETHLATWTALETIFPNLMLVSLDWTPTPTSRADGRTGSTNARAVYLIQPLHETRTPD